MGFLPKSFCGRGSLRVGCYAAAIQAIILSVLSVAVAVSRILAFAQGVAPLWGDMWPEKVESGWDFLQRRKNENLLKQFLNQAYMTAAVETVWFAGGLIVSIIMIVGVYRSNHRLLLPWLSWGSVTFINQTVDFCVDVIATLLYEDSTSVNFLFPWPWFILLPSHFYMLFVVASTYRFRQLDPHPVPSLQGLASDNFRRSSLRVSKPHRNLPLPDFFS